MQTKTDVSFKTLTTLKVGGVAHTVHYLESQEELINALKQETGEYIILGGGSNVLAADGEYSGVVYVPSFNTIQTEEDENTVTLTAEVGVVWDELVAKSVEEGWWGFENLSGIPGTVGGALFQNIGAYGAVLSDTISSVVVFDTVEKEAKEFQKEECAFGYRTSLFKKEKPRYVILSARFTLKKFGEANISYKDLASEFANDPSPRLTAIRSAVLTIRRRKFPNLDEYGTAGSFFLNLAVSKQEAQEFQAQFPDMPIFDLPEGGVKIPIGWILEHVVPVKSMKEGGAFIWKEQALVIATNNTATATDVKTLAEKIKKAVEEKLNIKIDFEVNFL